MSISRLIAGYKKFRTSNFSCYHEKLYKASINPPAPQALMISCSDPRVQPEVVLQANPGDFLHFRNIGNLVPPQDCAHSSSIAAALEFAIHTFKIQNIIVCGHQHCLACAHIGKNLSPELSCLEDWLNTNLKATKLNSSTTNDPSCTDHAANLEKISTLCQLDNLRSYPVVQQAINQHNLQLHAWYLKLDSYELSYYDKLTHNFVPLEEAKAETPITPQTCET